MLSATITVRVFVTPVPIEGATGAPPKGRWQNTKEIVPAALVICTPDGVPFKSRQVTLADLKRFRDARGLPHGRWSFTIEGLTNPIEEDPGSVQVMTGGGRFNLRVIELVPSQSAPPLVADTLDAAVHRRYTFDLYRVGNFTARAKPGSLPSGGSERLLRLIDPDGVPIAPPSDRVSHPISLATLAKSRDAQGQPRPWTLEVFPVLSKPQKGDRHAIAASVVTSARIGVQVVNDRIERLLGPHGNKLEILGAVRGSEVLVQMRIKDPETAGIIDMHNLLEDVIKSVGQEVGVTADVIQANVLYTLMRKSRDLGAGVKLNLTGVKVRAIDIALGASEQIQPAVPALKIGVQIDGHATLEFHGLPFATARLRDGRIRLEAGLRTQADGSFAPATWIEEGRVDIDLPLAAALAVGVVTLGVLAPQAILTLAETLENRLNAMLSPLLQNVATKALLRAPHVLAMVLGDDFTYRAVRLDGNDLAFDYDAPLEPDNKPTPGFTPIIGRAATQLGPDAWRLVPPSLGNTWAAGNLAAKVDHIVVVMMENRSFDHVMGWRARLAGGPPSDGLTPELTAFLEGLQPTPFPVRRLADVDRIPLNAVGLRTRFPQSVGHELSDVTQQVSRRIKTPAGRVIISPQGFVENFEKKGLGPLSREDVLGFYDGGDLPFFAHLTDHYAWAERYYSSHAGPTMPNRMFSLTGDLQHDRNGAPILDNNDGDNFSLSRAWTIFDLLTRRGVGWRIYESFPSVTMLRMFARWATDNTNIVDFSQLKVDVKNGTLPAVAVVEPAMHHAPQNDDHPVADMYRGQLFLKGVYDTLRSQPELWRKTLLIITYDEHGGFYDHVVPPLAEARSLPTGSAAALVPASVTTAYGVRAPTFVVSPWVPPGKGPDIVLDHCSILKTILARFCAEGQPFLSDRVQASHSFDAYLSATQPRLQVPPSPTLQKLDDFPRQPPRIETPVLSRKQMRAGNVDFHELTGMLARMLGR